MRHSAPPNHTAVWPFQPGHNSLSWPRGILVTKKPMSTADIASLVQKITRRRTLCVSRFSVGISGTPPLCHTGAVYRRTALFAFDFVVAWFSVNTLKEL